MQEKIENFLRSISYSDLSIAKDLVLEKVILKKDSETFEVFLSSSNPIEISKIDEVLECTKNGINKEKNV